MMSATILRAGHTADGRAERCSHREGAFYGPDNKAAQAMNLIVSNDAELASMPVCGISRRDQLRGRPGGSPADARRRPVDMAETNLPLGEPLPRPDPSCTDVDAESRNRFTYC